MSEIHGTTADVVSTTVNLPGSLGTVHYAAERAQSSPSYLELKGDAPVFDVDPRTGFMPPRTPLPRLPPAWEVWEGLLDDAVTAKFQVGDKFGITAEGAACAELWRSRARQVRISLHTRLFPPITRVVRPAYFLAVPNTWVNVLDVHFEIRLLFLGDLLFLPCSIFKSFDASKSILD
jgi:hypothetical protein